MIRPDNPELVTYVEQALASGIAESSICGMLTAAGWPERDIYDALAHHYQRTTGLILPARTAGTASAKDAFFYLLIFASLAVWTFAVGCMSFTLLDRWLPDPLFADDYHHTDAVFAVTASLAAMLVAFPIFLFVSRTVLREAAGSREKLESSVRKWLTYMALVIAACVMMGDLIAAIAYLLRGELTGRFVAKALVVLVLSGGTFYYYFGGLRRPAEEEASSRNRLMAGISSAVVALLVILGFTQLGSPGKQRELRADNQREWAIYHAAVDVNNYAISNGRMPPARLTDLTNVADADPVSKQPFEYHAGPGKQYQLCGVFAAASSTDSYGHAEQLWQHSAGRSCFSFDTIGRGPFPPPMPAD